MDGHDHDHDANDSKRYGNDSCPCDRHSHYIEVKLYEIIPKPVVVTIHVFLLLAIVGSNLFVMFAFIISKQVGCSCSLIESQ
jgi:hypothetical protein